MLKLSSVATDLVRDEGAVACQAGEPRTANPYAKGSKERQLWAMGWRSVMVAAQPPPDCKLEAG